MAVLPAQSSVASQQIKTAFEPQVSLERCIYREGFGEPASSYIIKSSAAGSRTIVNYNELPEMSVHEVRGLVEAVGMRTGWIHFEVFFFLFSFFLFPCMGFMPWMWTDWFRAGYQM